MMIARPRALRPRVATIPRELRERRQWVVWRFEPDDKGRWSKRPYRADRPSAHASHSDAKSWSPLHAALTAFDRHPDQLDGIGYVLAEADPFVGLDLDNCRDPDTGGIDPQAQAIVDALPTYWEVSPSGKGLRGIGRGRLEHGGLNRSLTWSGARAGRLEIYDRQRYLTVTGHQLPGTPSTVEDIEAPVRALYEQCSMRANGDASPTRAASTTTDPPAAPAGLDDEEVLAHARGACNAAKFARLWCGDSTGYQSASEADGALCCLLAFHTRDPAQLDRLFRRSGLMRAKWDERHAGDGATYGALTIRHALTIARETYSVSSRNGHAPGSEAPAFPVEALPEALARLVTEASRSMVVAPDFLAVPLLVFAGGLIGNARELELKPGWSEGPNLYAALVGEPGLKKTPALALAARPAAAIQLRLTREYEQAQQEYEDDLAHWESAPKRERPLKPRPPTPQHVLTTDPTVEALAPMLRLAKGIVLMRDELTGWVRSMDAYRNGRGADRQYYLSMWSRYLIKVDRKGGPPIVVPRPCLAVIGGVQPDLLPTLADSTQREDGFLDRLLWAYPEPPADHWNEHELAPEVVDAVAIVFQRLRALQPETDAEGEPVPRRIRLGGAARERWRAWYDGHVAESQAEHFRRILRGPWAKLPAQCARIVLLLHTLDEHAGELVAEETVERAACIVDYFKAHAQRVYALLGRERRSLVLRVLAALRTHGELSKSELLRGALQRNVPASRLEAALDELLEAGLIVQRQRQTAGRTAIVYALA